MRRCKTCSQLWALGWREMYYGQPRIERAWEMWPTKVDLIIMRLKGEGVFE